MSGIKAARFRWAPATQEDGRLLWSWRNDSLARRNSLDSAKIPWTRHRRWLRKKLADRRCVILIAKDGKRGPLGQLRLDLAGRRAAAVSIAVGKRFRGQGLAAEMLRRIPADLAGRPLDRCIAYIKPDNIASVVAFVKAGFEFRSLRRLKGSLMYRLEKRLR